MRPRAYYVARSDTTPDEPLPGWYWVDSDPCDGDQVHGPFGHRREAEDSIDAFQCNRGEIPG